MIKLNAMSDKNIPATLETRNNLYENLGKTIEQFSPNIPEYLILKKLLKEDSLSDEYEAFDAFLSLFIYIEYTSIESASVLRASFRANLPAERRYNIKWINCVILEAYKHLYGYGSKKNKSLWMSKIKPALRKINDPELINDFKELELLIVAFGNKEILDKKKRDLSFHYDLEPASVYDMLTSLSEEEETQRLINFMDLIQKIYFFISTYIERYRIPIYVNQKLSEDFLFPLFDIDLFNEKKERIFSSLETTIQSQSQRLDEFIQNQRFSDNFSQHFKNLDKESIIPLNRLVEIEKIAIQLIFIYIDLASALRAYISSEYILERRLSLKQVNIIIYEGFNKLYRVDDSSDNSFWNMYICPLMLETTDHVILGEFDLLNKEFLVLKSKIKSYSNQRQLSVHLDRGISEVYCMLQKLNPSDEIVKASLMLNFLPKILNFLTKCLHIIGDNNRIIQNNKMALLYEDIDNTIELLSKNSKSPQEDEAIKILESLKQYVF